MSASGTAPGLPTVASRPSLTLPTSLLVSALLAALLIAEAVTLLGQVASAQDGRSIGMDYAFYRAIGERWLTDGTYYLPHQLAGQYDIRLMVDVLYPPTALALFVPLVWLPAAAWWVTPVAVLGYAAYRWRPVVTAWPILILCLMWPRALGAIFYGNTDMWVAAAVAGGLLWGWPALIVALKPTFLPLAIVGIRRRAWWLGASVALMSAVAMAPLWGQYLTVITSVRFGWDYSLGSAPLVLLPIVAWLARSRDRAA